MVYHDGWAVFRFWAGGNRAPDFIEEDVENLLVSVGTSISDLTKDKLNSNKRLLLDSLLKTNDGFSGDYRIFFPLPCRRSKLDRTRYVTVVSFLRMIRR